ncbi:MAG: DUF4384 domain-containing protein [Saprospiraceae bacterium]|nr:DUF4384 domain-containing protein [Saprospiraceae bacterium]
MGLPDGPDEGYDEMEYKARLTTKNYRNIASKASVKQYAPTPKSQGQYGTCAAWATGFCARTILEAKRYGWTDKTKIDANIFSYGFIYRVSSSNTNCWGAYTSTCVRNMRDVGVPKLDDYSIHCPQSAIPNSAYEAASKYKIKGYIKLWRDLEKSERKARVEAVKKSLAEGNPVVIAMVCPNSFQNPPSPLWQPAKEGDDNPTHAHGRHAMCVVSYDDDKYGGAFEIQNSWGSGWGDGGYIWIGYEDFVDYVYQAMEVYHYDAPKDQEIELAGSLKLQLDNGQEMKANLQGNKTYRMDRAYRSGTRFRLYISNNEPAYVYAIGSDLTQKTYKVFPHERGMSAALTYSRNDVAIPSEDKHVRMDGTVGTDYLCVLYSKEPLNLEEIQRNIENQSSRYSFREKVEKVLGSKLMANNDVTYGRNGKISFNAKAKGKSVVALIVETEHID